MKNKIKNYLVNYLIFGVIFVCLVLLNSCPEPLNLENINIPVENGYGLIRVSFIGEANERTVMPSTTFDKYEYIFLKVDGNSIEKIPDSNGFFALEIGSYTVSVKAYIEDIGAYTLAANGVSSQFNVGSGNNESVGVRLSSVNTGEKGQLSYTITYPAGAYAEITLLKWPNNDVIALNHSNVSQGNGKTQTLQLDASSYLITVLIKKDGYYAGVSEAIHINSSITTEYIKQFNDDDLLEVRIPLTSDYNISGTGTFLYDGSERIVTITPKEMSSNGAATIYYEGTDGTIYAKSTAAPSNIGKYNVTIDVEAVHGWNAAVGLPVGIITINTLPVITISTHPINRNFNFGGISGNVSVSASVTQGATLSYQWYSNTSNSNVGGTVISGATNASYNIPTSLATGTYYYVCEVRATGGALSVRSNVATIIISPISVNLSNVTANTSSGITTHLTLTFSQAITGLTANDITLNGVSGIIKGNLSSSGSTYTLPVSGFTNSGTLTVSVSKTGYNISDSQKTVSISYASAFIISGGSNYTYANGILTITGSGTYTISMNSGIISTPTEHIIVSNGVNTNITLSNVNIDLDGKENVSAFNMSGATVNLTLIGENYLRSGTMSAGLQAPNGSTLVITNSSTGSLHAVGHTGAGIGGGNASSGGSIRINGGTITAEGHTGIGGGWNGSGGTINITGGSVTATGNGAGIGGGNSNIIGATITGGNITISGGTVIATSHNAAGIGGGSTGEMVTNNSGGTITISGGNITAIGNSDGAGIGGGRYGSGGTINISGGTINASATYYYGGAQGAWSGAGIGGGAGGAGGTIRITGGVIIAKGGSVSEGIGRGYVSYTSSPSQGVINNISGNAVIFASSIGPALPSGSNLGSAIIFIDNKGTMYNNVTLSQNITINVGTTLSVNSGNTLTIPTGIILTNNGTINSGGTINGTSRIVGNVPVGGTQIQ